MPRQATKITEEGKRLRLELGARLGAEVEQSGLTLLRLAELAGTHQSTLTMVIQGKRGIRPQTLLRIAHALGIPIERLTPGASGARPVPLVGRIAASYGHPFDADGQHAIGYVDPPHRRLPPGTVALRVRGDSMAGAGILEGDMVFVRPARTARDGDIVAATNDGEGGEETTLKRLRRYPPPPGVSAPEEWWLCPENTAYPPVQLRAGEAWIQGVVVCSLREYEGGG